MDAVSYSLASKQAQRIEKFIENPDSNSGVITQPSVIQAGEVVTVPTGRTAILANTQIDGTLTVDGTVFIPSGATTNDIETKLSTKIDKVTSTDNAIVRFDGTTGNVQNSSVVIDDSGNVGIGTSSPSAKLEVNGDIRTNKSGNGKGKVGNFGVLGFEGYIEPYDTSGWTNIVNTVGSAGIKLSTTGAERMRITSAGNLLIGTSTDKGIGKLQVSNGVKTLSVFPHVNGVDIVSDGNFAPHYASDFTVYKGTPGTGIAKLSIAPTTDNLLIGTKTDNGVDKLQVNGSIRANSLVLTDTLKVSSIYSQNANATTLTLTFNGDNRYLSGIIDIYYTNIYDATNVTASRKYIFNFSNDNTNAARNLTEIGVGIGSQLTLTSLVKTQVSGNNYNYVFTFAFPAGGFPRFKFLSSFESLGSYSIDNFTATIS